MMAAAKKRWTKTSSKNLVERARYASGNYSEIKRLPKGHGLRNYVAKETWKTKLPNTRLGIFTYRKGMA